MMFRPDKGTWDLLRFAVIVLVCVVWASNFFAAMMISGYETRESINGIFMTIVGGLLALGGWKNGKNGDDEDDENDKHGGAHKAGGG